MWQLIKPEQTGNRKPQFGDVVEDRYFIRSRGIGFKRMLLIKKILEEDKNGNCLCEVKEMKSVRLVPRRG